MKGCHNQLNIIHYLEHTYDRNNLITFQITCCTSGNRRLSENNIFNERRKDKENDKASCVKKKKEEEREHNLKCRKLKEQSAL